MDISGAVSAGLGAVRVAGALVIGVIVAAQAYLWVARVISGRQGDSWVTFDD